MEHRTQTSSCIKGARLLHIWVQDTLEGSGWPLLAILERDIHTAVSRPRFALSWHVATKFKGLLDQRYLDLEDETSKLGMGINEKKINIRLHPPMNRGEMLGIYELETKYSKQFRASNTWEITSVTSTIITNA